jgi:hypothetical protein
MTPDIFCIMKIKKRVRDMSPAEQIAHYEDLRVFRELDKIAYSPMEIIIEPCIFGQALITTSFVRWAQFQQPTS